MKRIKIISKTENGTKAIKQHIEETLKLKNFAQNMAFKKLGYRQELIVSPNGSHTLLIEIKNPTYQVLIKPKHFCEEIEDTFKENNAIKDIDYIIEVE